MPRAARIRAVSLIVGVGLGVLSAPAPAHAQETSPTESVVTVVGGPRDSLTQGSTYRWGPETGVIRLSGTVSHIQVQASDTGAFGEGFTFDFASPEGTVLQPGTYERARRYPFQTGTHPGLDVSGNHLGCNTVSGRFVVRDLGFAPDGTVERSGSRSSSTATRRTTLPSARSG